MICHTRYGSRVRVDEIEWGADASDVRVVSARYADTDEEAPPLILEQISDDYADDLNRLWHERLQERAAELLEDR